MKKRLLIPAFLLFSLSASLQALAADQPFKTFGEHKVFFSAFNSSFVTPEVAASYNITRGHDWGLVNIAVVKDGAQGGSTALIKGHVANIIAQQQTLNFFEVREGKVVYYLAPFRFENEDSMTFKISIKPDPDKAAHNISFQRRFYHDE